jgi:hypothetical protein
MLLVNSFPCFRISTGGLSGLDRGRHEDESDRTEEEGLHVLFLSSYDVM